jgi:hypothetical protein
MSEDDDNSPTEEKPLNAVQFKGRCHKCGKYTTRHLTNLMVIRKVVPNLRAKVVVSKGIAIIAKSMGTMWLIVKPRRRNKRKSKQTMLLMARNKTKKSSFLHLKKRIPKITKISKTRMNLEEAEVNYTIDALEDNEQENIMRNNDWDLGEPYIKRWAKYSADGKFLGWKVCLVQDILPTEEIKDNELCNEVLLYSTKDEDQDEVEQETRKFLMKIAVLKKMKPMNINYWVDALSNKLKDIGITKVSHLRKEIVQLNKKLNKYGHSMLHTRTLNLIAQEAEKERNRLTTK